MFTLSIYSLIIMSASLIGISTVWGKLGTHIERHSSFLVSFSAGVFSIIAYNLAFETIEHSQELAPALLWIGSGALGLWILFKLLPTAHHHHDETSEHTHPHSKIDARRILISDALHNIGDGILIAAAYSISAPLAAIATLSIFFHELIQEISKFFVLKQARYTTREALGYSLLTATTIFIGTIGGYYFIETFEALTVPLLALSAGAFFVVVLHDLIPHSLEHSHKQKSYLQHLLWFIIGMISMMSISQILPHTHEDEHSHDYPSETTLLTTTDEYGHEEDTNH